MREVRFAQQAGADGVLCGVPFYYPSTADNAAQFYLDLADAFPKLGIGIYHNPPIHRVTIPVDAFKKLVTRPNIVFMQDSARPPLASYKPIHFYKLMNNDNAKIAVFVMPLQLYPYFTFGASG